MRPTPSYDLSTFIEPVPSHRIGSGTIQSWCWYHQEQTVHEAALGQKLGHRGTLGHTVTHQPCRSSPFSDALLARHESSNADEVMRLVRSRPCEQKHQQIVMGTALCTLIIIEE